MPNEITQEQSQEFKDKKLEIATAIFKMEAEKDKAKRQMKECIAALRDTLEDINKRILEKRMDFAKDYIEPELFE